MSGFVLTIDSDDESSLPVQQAAKPQPKHTKKAPAPKLSRKDQLKAAKTAKKLKRKRVDSASEDDGEDENEAAAAVSGDEEQVMADDFHFDGLGGGFVGERRQQVWVRGEGCACY